MNSVLICPVCGHLNSAEAVRCAECWGSLTGVEEVSRDEAQRLSALRQANQRRRRQMRLGLAVLVALAVIVSIVYAAVDPFSSLNAPVSTIGADPDAGEWAMFRRDPSHSAFDLGGGGTPVGELKWRYSGDAPIPSSPAMVDGRVYLSTGDRRVLALDAETGHQLWEQTMTGPIDSSVAVAGDLLFVGLRDARVLALNRHTGDLMWEFRTGGPVHRSPAVLRGEMYIGSDDFALYALDAMTGEERWHYRTGARVSSSVAVNEEVVAATSDDKYLYIFDRSTGRPRMDFRLTTASGAPVFAENRLFVVDGHGRLTAINWREDDRPFEKLAAWVGLQMFAWGLLDEVPAQRGFLWSFLPDGDALVGTVAVARDKVYASSSSGALYALAASTGDVIWEFQAASALDTSPSISDQTVFVADSGGTLYAVDVETGRPRWELDIGAEVLSAPVIADGVLYVSTADGTLHAIR